MFYHLKRLDWILIASALLLVSIGLLALYSSSIGKGDFSNFRKQIIFAVIGIFLMFLFSFSDYRIFKNDHYLILTLYFVGLVSLIGLFFIAPEIRGVKSWYKIGPISIDPSEFIKLVLLIFLANYFSLRHVELYRLYHIFISGFYIFLPVALIALQPNSGSALILVILWLAVLLISGIKLKIFLSLCVLGILIITLGWSFLLQDYQKERIMGFIIPDKDPLGINWNQAQAKIAIGSGGIFGQGFGKGSQTQYGFLPESQTDFIFAAIAEEFGLIGVTILFLLIMTMLLRIIRIAINSQSNFPRLFASGFAILLVVQIFVNLGMNLGLLPVIGIPLPLISYGGSNLIIAFTALGIVQNISKH
ncbi:MAG: rod shape-determining protein RodA [Candidatus Nealsonbacteria bacterium]|nr:rod shape-determining protein RodA [Candidatus Nealsonbacteria bacterium]